MKSFIDLIKLGLSVGVSAFVGKRVLSCLWELTYRCTGKCEICSYWRNPSNPEDELKLKDIKKGLKKIRAYGCCAVNFTGGEPTLRPDLEDIVNNASSLGMWTSMVTNGSLLTQERVRELKNAGLDILLVSLDSVNPQFHDRQRGVNGFFAKVHDCLHWLREDFLTRHRMGGIMCVLTSMNILTVKEILKFADEHGVYVLFQPYHDNKTGETKFIVEISEKVIDNILYKNKQLKNVINRKLLEGTSKLL